MSTVQARDYTSLPEAELLGRESRQPQDLRRCHRLLP